MLVVQSLQEVLSPDVRMRAAFYQRLIQMDETLQLASRVVYVQKPTPVFSTGISDELQRLLSG